MHAVYLAAVGFGLLALTSEARADGGEFEAEGTGTFVSSTIEFKLTATGTTTGTVTTGTVTSGTTTPITGHAEINSEDANGTTSDEVEILTHGLTPDTYTVAITKISDSSTLTLGNFTVAAATGTTTTGTTTTGTTTPTRHHDGNHQSVVFGTNYGMALPTSFDPTDVATLTISSSAPAVVLSGTTASGRSESSTSVVVAITPGPLAISTTAGGDAAIESETENGKTEAEFSLYAKGLPVSTAYTLAVNGTDVMSVTTDTKGRLKVHALPSTVDVSTINSVTVHDATNALLLTATF
jgi:hypothetical protein